MGAPAVVQRGVVTTDTHRLFAETVLPYLDDAHHLARWLTGNATDAEDVTQEACMRALRALERAPVAKSARLAFDDHAQHGLHLAGAQPAEECGADG